MFTSGTVTGDTGREAKWPEFRAGRNHAGHLNMVSLRCKGHPDGQGEQEDR